MDVEFEDAAFGHVCNDFRALQERHGKQRAELIARRLVAMNEADCLEDLRHAPGRLHELTGDRAGDFAVDLDHWCRLTLRPTRQPPPTKPDGEIDWSAVDAVTVTQVVDTY